MTKWLSWLRSDQTVVFSRDTLVLSVALVALLITVIGAMRAGTFEAIADVMKTGESNLGCVRTAESGATDLSGCH